MNMHVCDEVHWVWSSHVFYDKFEAPGIGTHVFYDKFEAPGIGTHVFCDTFEARRNQEEPGRCQGGPGEARRSQRSQEQPGGARGVRSSQEEPEEPGESRDSQEEPGEPGEPRWIWKRTGRGTRNGTEDGPKREGV